MKSLTKAEEQIMQALWKLQKAFLRQIVDAMPAPKPHQNTVATLLKILIEKGFVGVTVLGRHTSTIRSLLKTTIQNARSNKW
jgi:predicted transcriptional regulator